MIRFSIVVPALNEAEKIDLLLTRLFSIKLTSDSFQVIIVDDASTGGTPEKARAWIDQANVRLVERKGNLDLTASVLSGVALATSDVIVVMDGGSESSAGLISSRTRILGCSTVSLTALKN